MLAKVLVAFVVLQLICSTNAGLNNRLDCHLENDFKLNQKDCEERGCIWDSHKQSADVPVCYLDPEKVGYKKANEVKKSETGLNVDLVVKESAKTLFKNAKQIENLKIEVTYLTDRILRFKVVDAKNPRYEVPFQKNFPLLQKGVQKTSEKDRKYSVELSESKDDFSFSIRRKDSKTKLFDTSIGGLVYSDQFLQIATNLPSKHVYGLGEDTHHSLKHKMVDYKTYPMFTQDQLTGGDDVNEYGVHPFYTILEEGGKSHGVLLLNSNAMECALLPEPALAFRTLGGVLDFFVFVGDNPGHVISLYTSLIGTPAMPPFWGLGFQLSRFGHPNISEVQSVIDRNIKAKVPLDIMYIDSDYMNNSRDFTYDHVNFTGLPKVIRDTKAKHNLRWTFIVDPGIEAFNNPEMNPPFTDGYKKGVFITYDKSIPKEQQYNPPNVPLDKGVMYGKVWPDNPDAFPDFFKNVTQEWWQKWLSHWYNEVDVKFDALWIDMNEPANQNDAKYTCPKNKYDFPNFRTKANYVNNSTALSHKTLCMVGRQGEKNEYLHYDVHSLYGLSEMITTQKAIHAITKKRGFAVSRSTYVSSGRYGTHWLGDNASKWPHMKYSIIGMLEMNMFGIPFVGPDICGFMDNSTPELCKRWSALGAFNPFSRNHNCRGFKDQDPGVWVERGHPEVTAAARNSLTIRYMLLPYFYTLFYKAHTLGHTVLRPVFHEFPTDNNTYDIDEQFMLGNSILLSPFLYQDQKEVKAYLPDDIWYYSTDLTKVNKTGHVSIPDNREGVPPMHFRGGSIIPIGFPDASGDHMTTENIRKGTLGLLVLPGKDKKALGELFWDDGESIETIEKKEYNYYVFDLEKNCSLNLMVKESGYAANQTLKSVSILGNNGDPVEATLDGKPVKAMAHKDEVVITLNLNLKSKKAGEVFKIEWKSTKTNSCNIV